MDPSIVFDEIKTAIYNWLQGKVGIDEKSANKAIAEITLETKFSDLEKKYGALDKTILLYPVLMEIMRQERSPGEETDTQIPDRFTESYADELADLGYVVGATVTIDVTGPVVLDAAAIKAMVNDDFMKSIRPRFTTAVQTEIENVKTVGDLVKSMTSSPTSSTT
ncbi:hypothetical protein [Pseudomonas syringae pv. coryli]|uniref:Uncharacterized protein n=1 Tax=Pseudomonas syringae pv. coryli TaxID=317659 RepID=A0A0P9NG51_9PSED|nr:hypothetical protein [Pseudomonas syringae pv. coryli]KPW97672.1 Uncharacterized protein ALO75_03644 [Pseudomonas syringae pv. coryli]